MTVKTLRRISSDFVGKPKKTSGNQKKRRISSDFFFDLFCSFRTGFHHFGFLVVNLDDLVLPGAVSGSVPTGLHAVAISRHSAGAMPSTFAFVKQFVSAVV